MKKLIALILLSLTSSLSTCVSADEHSTLRVVVAETDDVAAYIAQLNKGSMLIKAITSRMTIRS
ncbi:MAG: hypothetical protein QMC38_02220 [Sinobacterium sp.]